MPGSPIKTEDLEVDYLKIYFLIRKILMTKIFVLTAALALLPLFLNYGTLSPSRMIALQEQKGWGIVLSPFSFVLLLFCFACFCEIAQDRLGRLMAVIFSSFLTVYFGGAGGVVEGMGTSLRAVVVAVEFAFIFWTIDRIKVFIVPLRKIERLELGLKLGLPLASINVLVTAAILFWVRH